MRKFPLSLLFISLALCLNGAADTVTLKDGTVIEGTITQQDASQVTITYKFSDSVTDTRILKMTDIDKIEKTPEDGLAFEKLKDLKPDPWQMLTPEAYASTIAELKDFIAKYPQSSHKAAVQAILNTFQDEQAHQQAGDVKLYGHWIPKEVALARDYQIQAQSLYVKMQASAAQGDLIAALNTFDQLEKNYGGSRIFPTAVGQAKGYESSLQGEVSTAMDNLKVTDEQWRQGVTITPEPDKSQMIGAHQADLARYAAIIDAATRSGVKWPPLILQSQKSLDAIAALLATDQDRLLALPLGKMNDSIAATDRAAGLLAAGDVPDAESGLKSALLLWSVNEEALYLQKAIVAAKAALKAHPAAKATPVLVSGFRTSASGTAAASTPAPAATSKPKATPISAIPEPAKSPLQAVIDFLFTIPGAVTVVVCAVGLIVMNAYLQKSKRDRISASEEHQQ